MVQTPVVVQVEQAGRRLDSFLSNAWDISRSRVQRAIKSGCARVNGRVEERPSYRVRGGDEVEFELPEVEPLDLLPSSIPIDVLYQDEHLIVVNKAAGMVVHPGPGHTSDTLVNALLHHVSDLSGIGGVSRPGIVHRLDRDTSGVLVVAKHDRAHEGLAQQFAAHTTERVYIALVVRLRGPGLSLPGGTIESWHGRHPQDRKRFSSLVKAGRRAITHYRVVEEFSDSAMRVECRLDTGRTHQIRVHLADKGCPILGDLVYGGRVMRKVKAIGRQALHARVLGFEHPLTGEFMRFEGEFPDDFRKAEDRLRCGGGWR